MGLSIYLYRSENFEKAKNAESNSFLGSDIEVDTKIEFSHPKYPTSQFKIGYFNSSYTSYGLETVLLNMGLPTIHEIFQKVGTDVKFKPDWNHALLQITALIDEFKKKGAYRVHKVPCSVFKESEIKDEKQALDIFLQELSRENKLETNYSNSYGDFTIVDPLKVLALIPGKSTLLKEYDCVYVVIESDNTEYLHALEIIKATCEYVLDQDDKEKYYLLWRD